MSISSIPDRLAVENRQIPPKEQTNDGQDFSLKLEFGPREPYDQGRDYGSVISFHSSDFKRQTPCQRKIMSTDVAAQSPNVVEKKPVGLLLFKIVLALVVIVGALAGYVSTKPNEFRVERSATIAASPDAVFEHVNDFRKWEAWSPWAKLDPTAKNSFEGTESGKGAVFKWVGNDKVGEGAMTIVDSQPPERL